MRLIDERFRPQQGSYVYYSYYYKKLLKFINGCKAKNDTYKKAKILLTAYS